VIPFAEHKIDALLVSAPANVRYLCGFTGSNGLLLVTPDSQTLFTDPRYTIQASEECRARVKAVKTISKGYLDVAAMELVRKKRLKRVGFEAGRVIFDSYQRLKQALPLAASLKPIAPVIDKLRMIKSDAEIARIRRSVLANSEAFAATVPSMRPAISENDIAAELEFAMRRLGAEKPAFETIVASGARTALPHAQPTHQKLAVNELLLIDMGTCLNGYMSDMTRMLFLGNPNSRVRKIYNAVLEAQMAGIAAVRAGVKALEVDRRARQVLRSNGLGKEFVHSTGHGLGLEIHESPRIGKNEATTLEAGMVITIEPGAYIRDFGGVRIEDTVLVTKSGCEVLTPTPKELVLL